MDEDVRRKVEKHDRDLYQGNGKPALTVRMAVAEERIETVKDDVTEIKDGQKTMKNMILGLIGAAVLQVVAEIVVKLVMR